MDSIELSIFLDSFIGENSRRGVAVFRAKQREVRNEGVEPAGAQRQEMKFALPRDIDQSGGFEFFDVVRYRGGGDGQCRTYYRTPERTICPGNSFQQFKPLRVGQRLQNGRSASTGEAGGFPGTR